MQLTAARGATFYRATGPVMAVGNHLPENPSTDQADPVVAAFEVYAEGNVTMTGNTICQA